MKKSTLSLVVASAAALYAAPTMAQDIPVKIGLMTDLSGVYSDISGPGSVAAAEMAIEDFDPASKGMDVELLSVDHQNKPDIASNLARQWLDRDNVNVIVDVPTSSAAFAVHELVRDRNALAIISGAASSELTGSKCGPHTAHWTYDTWMLAHGTGKAVLENGGDSWFFITPDYTFGHQLEAETGQVVEEGGGEVKGSVRYPFPGQDFSSFILQAQGSGAKIIGITGSGGDMVNLVRQSREFGVIEGGQQLASLMLNIRDVQALGLEASQGLTFASVFDWNINDDTRAWSKRFNERMGAMPTMMQAGIYSGVLHYLKAVEKVGSTDADAVIAAMKEMPTDDPIFGKGKLRADGRKIHDVYLMTVKTPEESEGEWDFFKVISTIPAEEAFRPMAEGGCPLVE